MAANPSVHGRRERDQRYADPQVEPETLRLFAHRFPDDYYHSDNFADNRFELAEKKIVPVQIDLIVQPSPKNYQPGWPEQARDLTARPAVARPIGRLCRRPTSPPIRGRNREKPARFLRDADQVDRPLRLGKREGVQGRCGR